MPQSALSITLEFARADKSADPYAFQFSPQRYLLRSEGGTYKDAELAWDRALMADLQAVQQIEVDPQVVARLGDLLGRFLAPAGWNELAGRIAAALEADQAVHLTLRSAAAELYALPWELLRLPGSGQALGALPGLLLRHAWPGTTTTPETPSPRPEGGRLLLGWSAAAGRVPHRQHAAALSAAARAGHLPYDADSDLLPDLSLDALTTRLADPERPVALLHLLCHGVAAGGSFGLGLDGAGGDMDIVDPARLARALAPHAGRLRCVVLMACHSGNPGALGGHLGSIGQELHRAGIAVVIASRFPLSIAGSVRFTRAFYRPLLVQPDSAEQAFLAGRRAVADQQEGLDWASLQLYARPQDGDDHRPVIFRPYRGLLAFHRRHARFFFGRDAERTEVLADLERLRSDGRPRFLVVAGASGTGKSSVVLAGALTDLLGDGADPTEDDDQPTRRGPALEELLAQVRGALGGVEDADVLDALARLEAAAPKLAPTSGAWQFAVIRPGSQPMAALRGALATPRPPGAPLLLIVDQFEEVFTLAEPDEAQDFAARLWAVSRLPDSGVSVVITIRVDFLGQCGELVLDEHGLRLDKVAYEERHRVFVAQMGAAQLRAAIERPAAKVGLSLEPGLADRMLAEVEGEPGALPLLSYSLDLLWQRREGRQLRQSAYEELGGVVGALHKMADALIDQLDALQRTQARRLLVRLVGLQEEGALDTRKRVALPDVRPQAESSAKAFDQALDRLVDARLLVRGEEGGAPTVEVAHEALIRKWERLRLWVHEDRDKLQELDELADWVAQCEQYKTLLEGDQLARASAIVAHYPEDVDHRSHDLVARSHKAVRRREILLRVVAVASVLLAFVFAGLALWGWQSTLDAEEQAEVARSRTELADIATEKARREAERAAAARDAAVASEAEAIAAQQAALLAQDEALAAREEAERQSDNALAAAQEARDALEAASQSEAKALDTLRMLAVQDLHADPTRAAPFLRDVLPRPDLASWAPEAWHVLQHPLSDSRVVVDAPSGRRAVTIAARDPRTALLSEAGELTVVEAGEDGPLTPRAVAGVQGAEPLAMSPDGSRVAVSDPAGIIRVHDIDEQAELAVFHGHGAPLWGLAFSPDGRRVASASRDGTARVWTIGRQAEPVVLQHEGPVWSATFSPGGDRVLTAAADGFARLWTAEGALLGELAVCTEGRRCGTLTTAFRSDGSRVAVSGAGNASMVWDPQTGQRQDLALHASYVIQAAFNPEVPTQVATLTWRGLVRIWNVPPVGGATLATTIPPAHGPATALAWREDGGELAVGHADGAVLRWRLSSAGRIIGREVLRGHAGAIVALRHDRDGGGLTSVDDEGEVRTWQDRHLDLSTVLPGAAAGEIVAMAFHASEPQLLLEDRSGMVQAWDLGGKALGPVSGVALPPRETLVSMDGLRSWVDEERPSEVLVQRAGGEPIRLVEHWAEVDILALSPDGAHLATVSRDRTVRVWPLLDEADAYARLQALPVCASADDRQLFLGESAEQARAAATVAGCL